MTTVPANTTADVTDDHNSNIAAACCLGVVCVISAVVNVCMWIIICRKKDMRTQSNAFILSLSTADLLVGVLNMPVTVVTMGFGRKIFSDGACIFMGLSNMVTFVTSVMSLCGISVNRYVMVCMSHRYKTIFTTRNTSLMIAGIWLFSLALSSPPLMGWGKYDYLEEAYFCFCDWKTSVYYAFFMIGTCFGIPFIAMIFCNFKILRTVKISRKKVQSMRIATIKVDKDVDMRKTDAIDCDIPEESFVSGSVNELSNSSCENNHASSEVLQPLSNELEKTPKVTFGDTLTVPSTVMRPKNRTPNEQKSNKVRMRRRSSMARRNKDELHLTISLVIAICLFVVCWLPYCVSMVLTLFFPNLSHGDTFDLLSIMLGYSNSCFNPIIYGLLNRKFRAGFKHIFCFWRIEQKQQSVSNSI